MSENKDCNAMGLIMNKTISNLKPHLDLLSALTTWQNAQKKAQDQNPAQPDDAKQQPEEPKAEPKFKIGDRVRIGESNEGYEHLGFRLDRVFQVIASCVVHDRYVYLLECKNGDIFLAHEHCLWIADDSYPTPEKPQFKPFDRVLTRDSEDEFWRCNFFSHESSDDDIVCRYVCVYSRWKYCIPYEGNETLVGTTNDPEKG